MTKKKSWKKIFNVVGKENSLRVKQAIFNLLPSKTYRRGAESRLSICFMNSNLEYSSDENNYDIEIQSSSIYKMNACIFISSDEHCVS